MSRNRVDIAPTSRANVMLAAEYAKEVAQNSGFSKVDQVKIAISVSELAMNIFRHAQGKGKVTIETAQDEDKPLIIITAEDSGPGISKFQNYESTFNIGPEGMGEGLGAVKRLMDECIIDSKIGIGTKIVAKKWRSNNYE